MPSFFEDILVVKNSPLAKNPKKWVQKKKQNAIQILFRIFVVVNL